jgi:hypothetical protein
MKYTTTAKNMTIPTIWTKRENWQKMLVSFDGHELTTPVKNPSSGREGEELFDLLFILLYTPSSFWHPHFPIALVGFHLLVEHFLFLGAALRACGRGRATRIETGALGSTTQKGECTWDACSSCTLGAGVYVDATVAEAFGETDILKDAEGFGISGSRG